ncbi:CLUMA_CG006553, isoform A [Clunio marinus]|uniref:CLUMA_CG006553, isoform A n=1 Tax=Clunio marinus TaxID=568069 RepID=A0A1J1HZW7_9DIPT|nr:CLUMA_CG006553, isoform A [Clunio marinus]
MEFKMETSQMPRRSGGRPHSEGWSLYGFQKVPGDKRKFLAKCNKCLAVLKNTSVIRMANHRKKCGVCTKVEASNETNETNLIKVIKIVSDEHEMETEQHFTNVAEEEVNHSVMEVINEDINRHRKNPLNIKAKPDLAAIDAALSSFIIGCNLTFDIIDSEHFKKFVATLNRNYKVPSGSQLKERVLAQLKSLDSREKSRRAHYYDSSSDEFE